MLEQIRNICLSSLLIMLPAFFIAIGIFRNTIIRRIHRENFPKDLKFEDLELVVTPSEPLRRTILLGSALYVPHGVNAVIARTSPTAQRLYEPGDYIITDLRAAVLFYKYVDITLRHLRLQVEDAPTKDGFNVTIKMKLSFRVTNAEVVANMDEPVLQLIMSVENAIRNATLRYDHNTLVPTPGIPPVGNSELVNWIRDELIAQSTATGVGTANEIQILRGINLLSIVIQSRIKDPNRNNLSTGPSEAEQAVLQAENHKDIAAIEGQTRLQNAKILLEEDEILIPVRERELEWEQRRAKPQLDMERERIRIQTQMKALTPALQIFAQILNSQVYNRMIYSWSLDRLRRMLEEFFESIWLESDANYKRPGHPINPRERLIYQLVDLWTIEGYVEHRLREFDNGSLGLMVFINNKQALFIFDVSGSNPLITEIILRSSSGRDCVVRNPEIYNSFTLAEAIEKMNERYHPERDKSGDKDGCTSWS